MSRWSAGEARLSFVTLRAASGDLHGVLHDSGGDSLLIHIHGFAGNFYHNRFVMPFIDTLAERGISSLFINTRGHDYVAESLSGDEPTFIGASVVLQGDIDEDLTAIVEEARARYQSVFLQGHSFGCDVIVRNIMARRVTVEGVILLSPADSYALQAAFPSEPHSGSEPQESRQLRLPGEIDILPRSAGIATNSTTYAIPISRAALSSFLQAGPGVFRYDGSMAIDSTCPTRILDAFAYIGTRDPFFLGRQGVARAVLSRMFQTLQISEHDDGDHHFTGLEREIASEVADWVDAR